MLPHLTKKQDLFGEITEIPVIFETSYLQSLDGLRAVSIIMVIAAHIGLSFKTYDHLLHPVASLGVEFFFVISGFLITTLLIKEKVKSGTISLRNFYIRRFFRIIPVAYLYLTIILIANFVLKLNMSYYSIFLSFLFLRNFAINAKGINNLSAHYWSLSVEEQFYVVFPVILKKNFRFFIFFLILMITFPVIVNFYEMSVQYIAMDSEITKILIRFFSQFQAISVGALCSILLFKKDIRLNFSSSFITLWTLFSFALILTLTFIETPFSGILRIVRIMLFASILILNLQVSNSLSFKFLNYKPIKFIGILSYSLYIWQQPFTYSLTFLKSQHFFKPYQYNPFTLATVSLGSIIALFVVGYSSYFFYEKRFLVLKNKYK